MWQQLSAQHHVHLTHQTNINHVSQVCILAQARQQAELAMARQELAEAEMEAQFYLHSNVKPQTSTNLTDIDTYISQLGSAGTKAN